MEHRARIPKFPKEILLLRAELAPFLPAEALTPNPMILRNYALMWLINTALVIGILMSPGLVLPLGLSILLGFSSTLTLFYTHILIHGHVVRSRLWQRALALPCMYYGVISPTFWTYWHHLHHRFGTLEQNVSGFQTINLVRVQWLKDLFRKFKPNQTKAGSFFYLFFWKAIAFTINQVFFVISPRFPKKVSQAAVVFELSVILVLHIAVWTILDYEKILLIEVIPWIVQNFLSSAFVVTNHHPVLILKEMTFQNTCTVHLGSRFLDGLFLNIGYHVEHHLFPECGPAYLPILSQLLEERFPYQYRKVHLFQALRTIFLTKSDSN